MPGSLSARTEQRFLEIEKKMDTHRALQVDTVPQKTHATSTSYIDDKIERYQKALEEALRNSPCSGCRTLVLSALTGLYIYKKMDMEGRTRADFTDQEIELIKKQVMLKYKNY